MSLAVVDLDTGEIIQKIKTRTYRTAKQQKAYVQTHAKTKTENNGKEFVWVLYESSKEYFPAIKPQNLARLMFLVTYLGYDGYLVYDNHKTIDKRGACKLLNLSRQQYDRFYKEMINNGIFTEDGERLYVNQSYFCKGNIKRVTKYKKDITRVYIDIVRGVYTKTPASSHKQLGYIFKVLPFVHQQYNTICKHPKEKDFYKIEPLSTEDFCSVVHYNPNQKDRIIKILHDSFKFKNKPLIYLVTTKKIKGIKISINPMLYHSGCKWNKVGFLEK